MMSTSVKRKTIIDEIKDDFKLWNVLWPSMTHSGWTSRYPKKNELLVDRIYFKPGAVEVLAAEGIAKFSGYECLIRWIREHRPKDVVEGYEKMNGRM
jgi:hypothetical protein